MDEIVERLVQWMRAYENRMNDPFPGQQTRRALEEAEARLYEAVRRKEVGENAPDALKEDSEAPGSAQGGLGVEVREERKVLHGPWSEKESPQANEGHVRKRVQGEMMA